MGKPAKASEAPNASKGKKPAQAKEAKETAEHGKAAEPHVKARSTTKPTKPTHGKKDGVKHAKPAHSKEGGSKAAKSHEELNDLLVDYLETSERTLPKVPHHTSSLSLPDGHVEAKTFPGITKAACNSMCDKDSQCTGFKFTLKPEGKSEAECVTLQKKPVDETSEEVAGKGAEKEAKEAKEMKKPKVELKREMKQAVEASAQFQKQAENDLAELERIAQLGANSTATAAEKKRMVKISAQLENERKAKKSYQMRLKQAQREAKSGTVNATTVRALQSELAQEKQKEVSLKQQVKSELKKDGKDV